MQIWLDQHGIKADLNTKFGKALQQLNSQLASIVNNALDVALQAGNVLLNTVLTLIISIYFVADGSRLMAAEWRLLNLEVRQSSLSTGSTVFLVPICAPR